MDVLVAISRRDRTMIRTCGSSINHQRVAARAGNESTKSIVRVLNISLEQFSRKDDNIYIYKIVPLETEPCSPLCECFAILEIRCQNIH